MGDGAVKSHVAGAKHVANMTRSKQLTRTTKSADVHCCFYQSVCNLCLHLALFGDIILIVLLRILICCVDPVPVRNDYFGGALVVYVCHCQFIMICST